MDACVSEQLSDLPRHAVGLASARQHLRDAPHGAPEDASTARGSASLCGAQRQRGAGAATHSTRCRHDSRTRGPAHPLTSDTRHGHRQEDTDATRLLLWAPRSPAASPAARPRRWDGAIVQSSPRLVQWDCSPLQVLWRPGAGGTRPAGSSKMQGCAQPPAGRQGRGRAPGTVLLVGTRGTRKGSGRQPHHGGQRMEARSREVRCRL